MDMMICAKESGNIDKQDIDKHKQTLIKLYLIFSINHEMGSFEIEIILF